MFHSSSPNREKSKPDAIDKGEGFEFQQIDGRRQFEEIIRVINPGIRGIDHHVLLQTEHIDQRHDFEIIGEPMMVEAIQPGPTDIERSSQAA